MLCWPVCCKRSPIWAPSHKILLRGLQLVPMFGESIDSSNQITKGLSTYPHAVGLDPAIRDAAGPRGVGRTITNSECDGSAICWSITQRASHLLPPTGPLAPCVVFGDFDLSVCCVVPYRVYMKGTLTMFYSYQPREAKCTRTPPAPRMSQNLG